MPFFMYIKKITMENFRNVDFREVNFGPELNFITGENGVGKSSIAEAISFGLFGTTFFGSNRCDNLIKKGTEKTAIEITVLLPNSQERIVKRIKTRQTAEVYLDGEKVASDAVLKALGVQNVQDFLAAFNPIYLLAMAESEPKKAREYITSLFVPPTRTEVLEQMSLEEQALINETDTLDASAIRKLIKQLNEKQLTLKGHAEALRKQTSEVLGQPKVNVASFEAVIKELQGRKQQLEKEVQVPKPSQPALLDVKILEKQVEQLRSTYSLLRS